MNSTKKSILEPFDESSFIRARCYLYDGYYSPMMASPLQIISHGLGVPVINIIVSKN